MAARSLARSGTPTAVRPAHPRRPRLDRRIRYQYQYKYSLPFVFVLVLVFVHPIPPRGNPTTANSTRRDPGHEHDTPPPLLSGSPVIKHEQDRGHCHTGRRATGHREPWLGGALSWTRHRWTWCGAGAWPSKARWKRTPEARFHGHQPEASAAAAACLA